MPLLALSACGGSGGGSGSGLGDSSDTNADATDKASVDTQTPSNTPTNGDTEDEQSVDDADAQFVLLQDDDDRTPYVIFRDNAQSALMHYHEDTHEFNGFTLIGPDGDPVSVTVDPATGLPTELIADDTIFLFDNINLEAGLTDAAVINSDGDVSIVRDVDFGAFAATVGQTVPTATDLAANVATRSAHTLTPVLLRNHQPSLFGNKTPQEVTQELERASGAANIAWSISSCTVGSILTVAAAAGVAIDPVKIFGITAYQASATLTAATCSAAFVAIWKEKYPQSTRVTTAENALETIDDLGAVPGNLADVWQHCRQKFTVKQCKDSIESAASIAKSGTVNRLSGSYLRARDGVARLSQFSVYCCNGPRRVRVDQQARWHAAIADGVGTPRYDFTFQWGDGQSTQILTGISSRSESHGYAAPGSYELVVTVSDQAGNSDISTTPLPTMQTPSSFVIEVLEDAQPASTSLSGPASVDVDTSNAWEVTVADGVGPFRAVIDWGDGTTSGVFLTHESRALSVSHTYATAATYNPMVTVTDLGFSRERSDSATVVTVVEPPVTDSIDASVPPEEVPEPTTVHPCHPDSDAVAAASWTWYRRIFGGGFTTYFEYDDLICWSYSTNYYYEYLGAGLQGYDCDSAWENCELDPEGYTPWSSIEPRSDGGTSYYYDDGNAWGVRIPITPDALSNAQ